MEKYLTIYVCDVKIKKKRNRKFIIEEYKRKVTKGNDFETRLKFLRLKSFCKDFNPKTDQVIEIKTIKSVGQTNVIDN